MENFRKLGLSKELTDVLKQFGFKELSEIQKKTIPQLLAGKDVIGGSATGSGKTLAFASVIIEKLNPNGKIQALILAPTRELVEQVANSIRNFSKNKKLNILAVYGGVSISPQIKEIPRTDIVVGTPGRIIDHINRKTLNLGSVKFLVIDEVDRMFDIGFSKEVEKIINECPKKRQTIMFSATLSKGIDYLSKKYTEDPFEVSVSSHVDSSKLKEIYYDVSDNKKFSLLVSLLKKENSELIMVFCNTRRNADFIAKNLIRIGIHAKAIHGKIEQKKRMRILDEFHKKGLGVLVCTDVAARGLDIKGVSHVYNYDVPNEPKDYIHRIGRTARAGKNGKAITILASRDYEKFGNLMQSNDVKINPEKLPEFEIVRIKIDSGKSNNRFSRGLNNRKNFDKRPRMRNEDSISRKKNSSRSRNSDRDQHNQRQFSRRPLMARHLNRKNNFKTSGRYGR